MKNKSQIAITIGVMCMLLTTAIVVQLNTIQEATKIVGTSYAEARLKDEVLKWKENSESQYKTLEETETELEKVRQEATKENSRGAELEEELSNINKLLGLTELSGSGVIVTLSDNTGVTSNDIEVYENMNSYIIHDEDIWSIVNELHNAGAEAISINGQRIINSTAISCSGTVITINGVKLNSPFKISAIGNSESLSSIGRPGGYLEDIELRGAIVNIEKSNNVIVSKYSGTITSKYMSAIK